MTNDTRVRISYTSSQLHPPKLPCPCFPPALAPDSLSEALRDASRRSRLAGRAVVRRVPTGAGGRRFRTGSVRGAVRDAGRGARGAVREERTRPLDEGTGGRVPR